jgi:hypothetical protein
MIAILEGIIVHFWKCDWEIERACMGVGRSSILGLWSVENRKGFARKTKGWKGV